MSKAPGTVRTEVGSEPGCEPRAMLPILEHLRILYSDQPSIQVPGKAQLPAGVKIFTDIQPGQRALLSSAQGPERWPVLPTSSKSPTMSCEVCKAARAPGSLPEWTFSCSSVRRKLTPELLFRCLRGPRCFVWCKGVIFFLSEPNFEG